MKTFKWTVPEPSHTKGPPTDVDKIDWEISFQEKRLRGGPFMYTLRNTPFPFGMFWVSLSISGWLDKIGLAGIIFLGSSLIVIVYLSYYKNLNYLSVLKKKRPNKPVESTP